MLKVESITQTEISYVKVARSPSVLFALDVHDIVL